MGATQGDSVLVVDDDEDVRSSFAEILRTAGYSVVEARDGFEALEHLRSSPVAALVLDILMPRLSGLELLDRLDDPPPVLLLTARDYDVYVTGRRSKVYMYLQKPVPPRELLRAVARATARGDDVSS